MYYKWENLLASAEVLIMKISSVSLTVNYNSTSIGLTPSPTMWADWLENCNQIVDNLSPSTKQIRTVSNEHFPALAPPNTRLPLRTPWKHFTLMVWSINYFASQHHNSFHWGHLETWQSLNTAWKINYTSTGNIYYGSKKYERISNIPFQLSQNYKTSSETREKHLSACDEKHNAKNIKQEKCRRLV